MADNNFFDFNNHSLIQFYHRNLAYFIIFYVVILSISIFKNREYNLYKPLKILLLFILFALVKAIVPRYRYDQLMRLGWKVFLPLSLIWVVLTSSYLFYFNLLPVN